jgi:CD151 antigen, putative
LFTLILSFIRNLKKHKEDGYFSNLALCFFIFSLLFLFTIQLCISIFAFISVYDNGAEEKTYQDGLYRLIQKPIGQEKLVYKFPEKFEVLQERYKCCGFLSYHDYNSSLPVPDSCCITKVSDRPCGIRRHPNNIYFKGCLSKISKVIRRHTVLLSSVAFGFSLVEIFGLIFSCCLYVQQVTHR